ncbi:cilia- and flagella-associated protein 251-like [Haliotis asinina]|uniref:cilia- and flagella-associated protein 251-like n=1 Tax=Haliotis asinina TaxID=109174 RepID=UPI00353215DA
MSLENTVKESQHRTKKKQKQKIQESDDVVKERKVKKSKEEFSPGNDENVAVSVSHSKTKKHNRKRHSEKLPVEERNEDIVVTDGKYSKAKKRKSQSEGQDGDQCVKKHQDQSSIKKERKRRERKDKFKDKVPEFLKLMKSKNLKEEVQPESVPKTPEEIALEKMKEEKRERMKKKRQLKKANKGKKIESTVAKDAALAYLNQWYYHHDVWRFQKVRQVWLLSHMYDINMVSDEGFVRLLKYLEDLKGHSRAETTKQAETILEEAEKEYENDGEAKDKDDEEKDVEEEEEECAESGQEVEEDPENESEDEDSTAGETKAKKKNKGKDVNKDVTSSLRYQRARQILQILT